MQRKRLLLVFMVSCVCLLPLDAGASKASTAAKILKGTEKTARNHSYGFSRAGIAVREFEKHNRLNRNRDSIYWDSSKRIRPIYMDSSIKWDSLNTNRYGNRQRLRDFAPYAESSIEEISLDEDLEFKKHSVAQTFETDSSKAKVDVKENVNKSNVTTTYYANENGSFAWELSLGLILFITLIICCCIKLFSKKGGSR